MIDIIKTETINITMLDDICRRLSNKCVGLSGRYKLTTIHLTDDATQADIDAMQSVFDGYGVAQIEAVPESITANDTDVSTITALVNASNTYVVFTVFDTDNVMQMESDSIATSAGVAVYEFKTALPGLYTIRCYGTITNETGFIDVEATNGV